MEFARYVKRVGKNPERLKSISGKVVFSESTTNKGENELTIILKTNIPEYDAEHEEKFVLENSMDSIKAREFVKFYYLKQELNFDGKIPLAYEIYSKDFVKTRWSKKGYSFVD